MSRLSASLLALLALALVLTSCGPSVAATNAPTGNAASIAVASWLSSKPFDPSVGAPLPNNRIVMVYGITAGGPAQGPASTLDSLENYLPQLQALGKQYAALDPTHPVKLGVDLVVNVIQPCSWYPDFCASWQANNKQLIGGVWVDGIQDYIDFCQQHGLLLFLDLQLGVQPVKDALSYTDDKHTVSILAYLEKYPFVELALDTEFHFPNTKEGYAMAAGYPCCLGWMDASEINWTIDKLAEISLQNHLPRKVLVIHEWNSGVLSNKDKIKTNPDVSIVLHSDGFGSSTDKIYDYKVFVQDELIQYGGYKLFLYYPGDSSSDTPLQTPEEIMQLFPQPLVISYQ